MAEENIIHTGIYGKNALAMIITALDRVRIPWAFSKSAFMVASDGELIYDSTLVPYSSRTFSDEARVKIKRMIGTCLLKGVRRMMHEKWGYAGYDCASSAQLRGFSHANEALGEKVLPAAPTATSAQYALMIEMLFGYREKKNLLKSYDEAVIKAVIGEAADPFTSGAVQTLLDELKSLKAERDRQLTILNKKYHADEEKLKQEWAEKIDAVASQIKQLRAAV